MADRNKQSAKREASDEPTALIAPSDYEHIFKGDLKDIAIPKQEKTSKLNNSKKLPRIASEQPTAFIAPSDYEHIFKGNNNFDKENSKRKLTKKSIIRVPSDTPTALIAPSDFEHIYCDPTMGAGPMTIKEQMNRNVTKLINLPKVSASKAANVQFSQSRVSKLRKSRSKSTPVKRGKNSQSIKGQNQNQQEVLPESIERLVRRFIANQSKSYTIRK